MDCKLNSSGIGLDGILEELKKLSKKEVYVGVPEANTARKGETVTNAQLAFIHSNGARTADMINEMQPDMNSGKPYSKAYEAYIASHGSPAYRVPPRPFIQPAIEADKETITDMLKQSANYALDGDIVNADAMLEKAGMRGQQMSQDWFEDPRNGWPPNAESTINAKGSDLPLIDTGELRKSITYVIRERE